MYFSIAIKVKLRHIGYNYWVALALDGCLSSDLAHLTAAHLSRNKSRKLEIASPA